MSYIKKISDRFRRRTEQVDPLKRDVYDAISSEASVLKLKALDDNVTLKELGYDSLRYTELLITLEDEVLRKHRDDRPIIPDSEFNDLKTVGQIFDYIRRKVNGSTNQQLPHQPSR